MGWDCPGVTRLAGGQIGRNSQLPSSPELHPGDALVPALDYLACADQEFKRFAGAHRAVKLLSRGEPASVIHLDVLAAVRFGSSADFDIPVLQAGRSLGAVAGDLGRSGSDGMSSGFVSRSTFLRSRGCLRRRENCQCEDSRGNLKCFHASPHSLRLYFCNLTSTFCCCHASATTSISTSTSFGSLATSTVLRAGGAEPK